MKTRSKRAIRIQIHGSLPPKRVVEMQPCPLRRTSRSCKSLSSPLPALLPRQFMHLLIITICRAVPCSILHCRLINERRLAQITPLL